jgi:hypothetical protein
MTSQTDTAVILKDTVTPRPPVISGLPGYDFFSTPFELRKLTSGNYIHVDYPGVPATGNSLYDCAEKCNQGSDCAGFNFRSSVGTCTFLPTGASTSSVNQANPYASDEWVKRFDTSEKGMAYRKKPTIRVNVNDTIPDYVNLSGTGLFCHDPLACNTVISNALTIGTLTQFDTADFEACYMCPSRKYKTSGSTVYTVTNEMGLATTFTTQQQAKDALLYKANGRVASHSVVDFSTGRIVTVKKLNGTILFPNFNSNVNGTRTVSAGWVNAKNEARTILYDPVDYITNGYIITDMKSFEHYVPGNGTWTKELDPKYSPGYTSNVVIITDVQTIQLSELNSDTGTTFTTQPTGYTPERKALLASGATVIQEYTVDPTTLSGNWAVTPPDCTTGTYSFSIDIKLETTWNTVSGSTFPLFLHAGSPNFYINNGGAAPVDWWEVNGICMYQSTIGSSVVRPNENQQVYNQLLTPGSWVNIIVVSDGIHVNTYVNGVLNSTITDAANRTNTSGIRWQTGAWTWGGLVGTTNAGAPVPTAGKCKIRNFYWFSNKVLSASEIATLQMSRSAVYTMSMDIKIQNTHTTYRNILSHGLDWIEGDGTRRKPAIYVTGYNVPPANRIIVCHESTELTNSQVATQFVAPLGQYFNLTWVVNDTSLDVYINGIKDGSISGSHFTWLDFEHLWTTRNAGYTAAYRNGPIYIKNMYFWNRAFTSQDVQTFGIPVSSSKYVYIGAGPCTNDIDVARTACRQLAGCDTIGQQSNGCWHCLKNSPTGDAPTAYTKGLLSLNPP